MIARLNTVTPSSSDDWKNFFQSQASKAGINVSSATDFVKNLNTSSAISSIFSSGLFVPITAAIGVIAGIIANLIKGKTQVMGTTEARAAMEKYCQPYLDFYDKLPQEGRDYWYEIVENFSNWCRTYKGFMWCGVWAARYAGDTIRTDTASGYGTGGGGDQRSRMYWIISRTYYAYLTNSDITRLDTDYAAPGDWYLAFKNGVTVPMQAFCQTKLNATIADIQSGKVNVNPTSVKIPGLTTSQNQWVLIGAAGLLVFFMVK